jgi:4-alpha-glucanotransferase
VWARRDLFRLDTAGQPTVVAGVPPDGYSPDGQRWGNPLYDWERMADDGFGWWVARVQRALALADVFRIDHFRGFAGCWEIPADCPSAREGRWVPAPGHALFEAVEARLGRLPIVAEDLGLITPDVVELRERFGFPGMRIVQEAFQRDGLHDFLPHRHVPRALAYTSTHDSDTALGWWRGTSEAQRAFAADYLGIAPDRDGTALPWALLRATQTSVAALALAPMQDLLALDGAHRMNLPGSGEGHWGWRFEWARVPPALAGRLRRLAEVAGRTASPPPG